MDSRKRMAVGAFCAFMTVMVSGCASLFGPKSIAECDGQDADWVRLSFPKEKSEEINALGYANWVDAQVGYGLENGYFKFVVVIPDEAIFPTEVTMGDLKVCAKRPGEYVFLCEKGREMSFGCLPFNEKISYLMTDDMAIPPYDPRHHRRRPRAPAKQ